MKHRDVEERGSIVRKEEEYNKRQQQHCARNSNGQQGSQQKETTENDYMDSLSVHIRCCDGRTRVPPSTKVHFSIPAYTHSSNVSAARAGHFIF